MGIQTCSITHLEDIWPRLPNTITELTERVLNAAINSAAYNADLPQIVRGGAGFTPQEREALRTPLAPNNSTDHPTIAELLWEKSSTEFQFEYSWGWVHVRYPDDPETVPGKPFRLQVRFTRLSARLNDLRVKFRLPENWSCSENEKGIYLGPFGEVLNFDIYAPETMECFEKIELEVRRNGMFCPDIITLPLQRKGSYAASLIPERPDSSITDASAKCAPAAIWIKNFCRSSLPPRPYPFSRKAEYFCKIRFFTVSLFIYPYREHDLFSSVFFWSDPGCFLSILS